MAVTPQTTAPSSGAGMTKEERMVIFASSLGTVFEWYDFYLYGSLAAIIAKQFFVAVNETTSFIFALLAFAAGFFVRPFGAIVFGRLGDLIGRKYTFLITILLMGGATFIVGVLPDYATPRHRGADHPHHAAHPPGPRAGRRVRRRRHLRGRARAERPARLLHLLHPDHRHPRPLPLAARHPRLPHRAWARGRSRSGAGASRSSSPSRSSASRSGSGSSSRSRRSSSA